MDSGEKSDTLTTRELQNYVQVGSNAAEYIKIMPGFGIQNGAQNKANYTGQRSASTPTVMREARAH